MIDKIPVGKIHALLNGGDYGSFLDSLRIPLGTFENLVKETPSLLETKREELDQKFYAELKNNNYDSEKEQGTRLAFDFESRTRFSATDLFYKSILIAQHALFENALALLCNEIYFHIQIPVLESWNFDKLITNYKTKLQVDLKALPDWPFLTECGIIRNAIVHSNSEVKGRKLDEQRNLFITLDKYQAFIITLNFSAIRPFPFFKIISPDLLLQHNRIIFSLFNDLNKPLDKFFPEIKL
ncbi:hypothetical protein BH11BAC7_BH11BAC7_01840 [soil metagenome]